MEALEHLVHDDPETLMDRRLLRDPEHPRELVLQGTGAVRVDVRRGQHHAVAARRQERLHRRIVPGHHRRRPPPGISFGIQQVVVERGRGEDLALLGGHGLQDPRVHVAHRLGQRLPLGALDQRRQLQQLEVPDDGMRHVEVGVEP